MVEKMRELHRRIAFDLDHDDEKAPVWFAHLPSGQVMPIHYIGTEGPLVKFTGFGASADTCDYALVSAGAVVVTIKSLPPEDDTPRLPIGFSDWPAESDYSRGSDDGEGQS